MAEDANGNTPTEGTTNVDQNASDNPATQDKVPAWEGDFDPERAARLVNNLRGDSQKYKDKLAELEKKLAEKEDAEKSEQQRLQERAERAEAELNQTRSALLVAEVAKEYGVPADLLSGKDREEIEARAKSLAEWANSAKRPGDEVPGRPKPKLVPGSGASNEPESFDPAAVAAQIRNRY